MTDQFRRFKSEKQEQLEQVKYLYQLSDQYVGNMKLFNGEEIYWKFILRRACLNLEASIQWANECLAELTGNGEQNENHR